MTKTILNIITTPYRATLEEQDDTILWLIQAIKNNGAKVDILLRGSSVNYGIKMASCPSLQIGSWRQKHPPDIQQDLKRLQEKDVKLYYLEEDATDLGLQHSDFLNGIIPLSHQKLAIFLDSYHFVWQW